MAPLIMIQFDLFFSFLYFHPGSSYGRKLKPNEFFVLKKYTYFSTRTNFLHSSVLGLSCVSDSIHRQKFILDVVVQVVLTKIFIIKIVKAPLLEEYRKI